MSDELYFEADDTEEGVYEATVTEIAEKTNKTDGGRFYAWTFTTAESKRLEGSSSMSGHPKSKGMKWARAILGRDLTAKEPLSTLYGRPCLVAVSLNANGYLKVDDVHPRAATQRVPSAPAASGVPQAPVATPPATGAPEPPNDFEAIAEEALPF